MPYTRGFRAGKLAPHHASHQAEFGGISAADYERSADDFLGRLLQAHVFERMRRTNGDRLRYDPTTNEFGVVDRAGYIKTYYVPDPAVHGMKDNLAYFLAEASK